MDPITELLRRMDANADCKAILCDDVAYSYGDVLDLKKRADVALGESAVSPGAVVAVHADYSPASMAVLMSLIKNGNIIVPLSNGLEANREKYLAISDPDFVIEAGGTELEVHKRTAIGQKSSLILGLVEKSTPGLVLFTSGTTGNPKAVLHDLKRLMSKFLNANKRYTTLCFLLFDHIGGVDTYFYSLFSGGLAVFPRTRDPEHVCQLIERHRVEVLPVSPTFLNLVLLSEAHKRFDMSSLRIITFGAERMSDYLLKRVKEELGSAQLTQKYGITEIGSPASKTHPEDASLIKVAGDKVDVRVIDGMLHVRTATAMIGYLNAESPFTNDGWYNTGDAVEVHGEYLRILGRKSDLINVGGEKVYPAEVESVISELDAVLEVVVFGERNPLVGEMVCARVRIVGGEDESRFVSDLKKHCGQKLEKHKVPVRVYLTEEKLHSMRYKKIGGKS